MICFCILKFEKSGSGEFHCAETIGIISRISTIHLILFYFWSGRRLLLALLIRVNCAHLSWTRSSLPSCQEFKINHHGNIYTTEISKYYESEPLTSVPSYFTCIPMVRSVILLNLTQSKVWFIHLTRNQNFSEERIILFLKPSTGFAAVWFLTEVWIYTMVSLC